MESNNAQIISDDSILGSIYKIRGLKIMFDFDLALLGDSDEPDHLIPGQADHQFRGKLTRGSRYKLTTLNV